ncbi:MAG TPA: EamA family transporter [Actinomycetota bacterium]|nr:EamA family transporter [Actinomycetota bacterium]
MSLQTKDYDGAAPSWMVWSALWVVYIVWGSTYLAIRVVVETLPPLLSAGARFTLAGVVLFAILVVRRGVAAVKVTRRELGASLLVGAALLLGGNGLVSLAERDVSSSLAALIIASTPLWVILLRKLSGDKISRGTLVGVAIGFAGVAILVLPGGDSNAASLGGLLLLVVAAASWASGSFFSSRLPLPHDPFVSTATQMVVGGLVLVVAGLVTGEAAGLDPSEFSGASIGAFAYLVTVGSLFAFTCYVWLLQNAPISKVATYAYVNPVIAIFLGWLILSESITTTILVGAAVIVSSVAFIVSKESAPQRAEADDADAPAEAALAGASTSS